MALLVALAVVPVVALNSFATANTGPRARPVTNVTRGCPRAAACGHPESRGALALPSPTGAQRRCLADQGVVVPSRGPVGTRATRPAGWTDTVRRAAEACGLVPTGRPAGVR